RERSRPEHARAAGAAIVVEEADLLAEAVHARTAVAIGRAAARGAGRQKAAFDAAQVDAQVFAGPLVQAAERRAAHARDPIAAGRSAVLVARALGAARARVGAAALRSPEARIARRARAAGDARPRAHRIAALVA